MDEDLQLFVHWMEPRPEEKYARDLFVSQVTKIIAEVCGQQAQAVVFGSFATDLYLPTSDIDMVILNSERQNPIHKLAAELRKQSFIRNISVITRARVPLIKFEDSLTGIQMDISFDMINGPRNVDVVNNLLQEYPQVSDFLVSALPSRIDFEEGKRLDACYEVHSQAEADE